MIDSYKFDEYDLTVIDFEDIFKLVQIEALNSSHLTTTNIYYIPFRSDFKRLFLHFLIKITCDCFNDIKDKNKVLLIHSTFKNNDHELWRYTDKDDVVKFIFTFFNKLKHNLPFPVLVVDEDLDLNIMSGELIDVLHNLSDKVHDHSFKPATMQKLKSFSKANGLNNLTNSYYVSSDFKKLMYNKINISKEP